MSAQPAGGTRGELRGVFVFALLAAFALLSLIVVVVGARSYRMINASAERAFVSRTGMSYLIGKVRGADAAGMIDLRNENGIRVLTLGQEFDGERYNTYIYCDKAQVREYFARASLAFSPDYGEPIFEASSLSVAIEDGLFNIEIVDAGGETHTATLYLQTARDGAA
ncbi:MAG: DUF4860 domain-containing protein [Eubacteriales bacterium]|jgi:hypothetical protein|nr:DUF4860 domain-containing protein [Eubacteriales bacterium]